MRDVKGKEGVNSKQLVPVRGRVIQGDAIAAMISYFVSFSDFSLLDSFGWLEIRTEIQPILRKVTVEFAERSERSSELMGFFFQNVAWSFEAAECNAIPHEAGSHQRSSLDPGSTGLGLLCDLRVPIFNFWSWKFLVYAVEATLLFSNNKTRIQKYWWFMDCKVRKLRRLCQILWKG